MELIPYHGFIIGCLVFPAYADVSFGGRSVILIGDFTQLPPIGEIPMYATAPKFPKVQTLQGITLYAQFDRFVRLRTNMGRAVMIRLSSVIFCFALAMVIG